MSEPTATATPAPPATTAIVSASGLTRVYGEGEAEVRALDGVDVEFPKGVFTAIMGPSGSGKSTLMHCLAGLDRPTSGTVIVDGVDLGTLDDAELTELRRDKVGFIFQFFNLLPVLDARENMLLPLKLAGRDPEPGRLEQLADVGRDHRSPRPPPVGALRRPAAARRDRAGAAFGTRRRLRRRADRQPRLAVERGGPRRCCARRSTNSARRSSWSPTTPSPPPRADRVVVLVDGKIVRDDDRPVRPSRSSTS